MSSRREVLLHGAIGAGVIASSLAGVTALAKAAPPKRRSLEGLAWNDPIVATYRDAVGIMKQKAATDKLSWLALASIHGTDPNTYHFCPHGDWYFLPWHRAFTAMYERIVRKLTGNNAFAMPYWDWTANPLMPEVFLDPTTPDGKPNWLCVTDAGWERTWPRAEPMPAENVGPAVLQSILAATGYETFGTSRNRRQNNLDPSWVPAGGGRQGILEGNAHNMVHNDIGGWMPSASSPRDPIFFMHHANIDRIWALWNVHNANSTDRLWTNMTFTNNFVHADGTAWSPKVSDLYVPETLGYTYGLPARRPPSPTRTRLTNTLTAMFALPETVASPTAGVATVVVPNAATARAGQPLEVAVAIPAAGLSAVRQRPQVSSGVDLMDFAAAQERAAAGPRVLAFLRDVAITDPQATMFRVFVDADGVSEHTPITDPHYVGTFGVFHHGDHAGHGSPPSFVVDLTAALQRSHGTAAGSIRLQLVAVTSRGAAGATGTATPGAIEVSLISN